ncbi:unnamed protein product [Rotaria socialis]|uniref:AIG1-type G domain-containing protein n=2 Tax=Rotaria TaxID=231623 RepID=A0A820Y0W4_9BILA|nr:unnamed protein product [Rotaria socialis]CAF3378601.1 unnamed protein product [Rotaria socialis]CAF3422382.1 unnamed protein product [Rotaria socialis]CAF4541541.1 unnamed protein product [Rotaria socialis]CAF4556519.1 unnamed protein product [Rotaria socialis]
MNSRGYGSKKPEYGIIILGNAGSGKSFICNVIIGSERFEADFRPEAVTTISEYHRMGTKEGDYLIYNIPGLIEINQEQIDRNKNEIMKAFKECPTSIVIFVWTQIGGRAQNDDVIAFNALNDAYKFPVESLMFVVNNVPINRPQQYEGKFLAVLNNTIKSFDVTTVDTIFIDGIDPTNSAQMQNTRAKLMKHIVVHPAHEQNKQHDIVLQLDELKQMRNILKQQQQQAEQDRARLEMQIAKMTKEHNRSQAEANERFQKIAEEYKSMQQRAQARGANEYKNPFKALLGFVDSTVDFAVGTTQAAGFGLAGLIDRATGTSSEEVSRRMRNVSKGTAAGRVFGLDD